jgi:hypothetical protein
MEQSKFETATDKLLRHIWTTYKARYNAHRRLLTTDRLQKFCLTTIAIYILAISVVIINDNILGVDKTNYANLYLIILSIISLALSLTMGQSENKIKALEFHQCSRRLQRLYNHILMAKERDPEYKISDEEDKYNNILDRYQINHDKIDWEFFIFEKKEEHHKKWYQVAIFYTKYFLYTKMLYLALILIPITVGIILFI